MRSRISQSVSPWTLVGLCESMACPRAGGTLPPRVTGESSVRATCGTARYRMASSRGCLIEDASSDSPPSLSCPCKFFPLPASLRRLFCASRRSARPSSLASFWSIVRYPTKPTSLSCAAVAASSRAAAAAVAASCASRAKELARLSMLCSKESTRSSALDPATRANIRRNQRWTGLRPSSASGSTGALLGWALRLRFLRPDVWWLRRRVDCLRPGWARRGLVIVLCRVITAGAGSSLDCHELLSSVVTTVPETAE
mmetsp:Transcript_38489/g.121748  ORF Transcript_38489/g.121748 Transcript_38489/m.121748 type:complete len:256 (+) Transcript_38489:2709-3476(+)